MIVRRLEPALVITWIAHGLGMLSIALLLLPGKPGGEADDDLTRMRYVAVHLGTWLGLAALATDRAVGSVARLRAETTALPHEWGSP